VEQKLDFSLNQVKKTIIEVLVYSITLPWLPVLSMWLLSGIVMIILNSEPVIRLGEVLPGDYSNFFTYSGAWFLLTIIVLSSLGINFAWFKHNKTHEVVSICVLFFLFASFAFLLWPEVDAFLKLRNIV
jgi:hypothetical protein